MAHFIVLLFLTVTMAIIYVGATSTGTSKTPMNYTNLMYRYFLACGYKYVCDFSKLSFIPKDVPSDIGDVSGPVTECPICSCNDDCLIKGDCCPDVYFSAPESSCKTLPSVNFNYSGFHGYPQFVEIVDECIDDGKNTHIANKCSGIDSQIDQLRNVPVTSTKYFQTFRNKFCAECYGITDYVEWGINFDCNVFMDFNYLSSYKDIVSLAIANGCKMKYDLYDKNVKYKENCYIQGISTTRILYDSCNETGHWRHYDADIVKACESQYTLAHRFYKNIFCYMCNPPSHFQPDDSVIDHCNVSGHAGSDMLKSSMLAEQCQKFGTSSVMWPFKNVFCYICYKITQASSYREGTAQIFDYFGIGQKNFYINFMIIDVSLYKSKYQSFLNNYIKNNNSTTPVTASLPLLNITDITNLLRHEFASTGFVYYCNESYSKKDFIVGPDVCSCNPSCMFSVERAQCCSDVNLQQSVSCLHHVVLKANDNVLHTDLKHKVINKCYLQGREPTMTQIHLCENGSGKDFYSLIPVTVNDIYYKNMHCFFCNMAGIKLAMFPQLDAMNVKGYCNEDVQYGPVFSLQSVVEKAASINCQLEVYTRNNMPSLYGEQHGSQIIQTHESEDAINALYRLKTQTCNRKTDDGDFTCNKTGTWKHYDRDVLNVCEQMTSPLLNDYRQTICEICNPPVEPEFPRIDLCDSRFSHSYSNETALACGEYPTVALKSDPTWRYRNAFCAMCNGIHFAQPLIPPYISPGNLVSSFNRYLFQIPMQNNIPSKFRKIDRNIQQANTIYDPYNKVVRNITCYPGRFLGNDTCDPLLLFAYRMKYSLFIEFEGNITAQSFDVYAVKDSIEYKIRNFFLDKSMHFPLLDISINKPCGWTQKQGETTPIRIEFHAVFIIDDYINRQYTDVELIQLSTQKHDLSHIGLHLQANLNPRPPTFNMMFLDFLSNCVTQSRAAVIPPIQNIYDQLHETQLSKVILCPQISFHSDEFTVSPGYVVNISNFEHNLTYSQFLIMDDGSAHVCVENLNLSVVRDTVKAIKQYSDKAIDFALALTNVVSVFLSWICLILTFITYCFLPSLRTLPGKNNMILVVTIFLTQVTLFLGSVLSTYGETLCQSLGIASHYFVLCMFTSMNVCSYHMYSVFANGIRERSNDALSRVVRYLCYVFILPAFVVGLNVLLLWILTDDITYKSAGKCMLSNRVSYIVSFYLPICILCFCNIIFFFMTFCSIRSLPKVQSTKKPKNEVIIYLKLFSITGITWILMLIDAELPVTVLSFVVMVLNAGQGVFIFLSFVCNKTVIHLYRQRFKGVACCNIALYKKSRFNRSNAYDSMSTGGSYKTSSTYM